MDITTPDQRWETKILPVDARKIGRLTAVPTDGDLLDEFEVELDCTTSDAQNIHLAAEQLRNSDLPVAFPTETVYGLGADATRTNAVKGIYRAKQRPADNPLIVHFASLEQLRSVLSPAQPESERTVNGNVANSEHADPIPTIYRPLISRFWPGPLTIILPNPSHSRLAPEVTAGLNTFGARIPRHVLALALIKLADRPVAAPSANASTKPSPTAAEHVAYDLDGRIKTIIDGGDCDVGVESTVVDGLSQPPLILRPGGISLEQLRTCPGWEETQIGYKNTAQGDSQPKAPGMKYRHYSPKAIVYLYEARRAARNVSEQLQRDVLSCQKVGLIRTKTWVINRDSGGSVSIRDSTHLTKGGINGSSHSPAVKSGFAGLLQTLNETRESRKAPQSFTMWVNGKQVQLFDVALGPDTPDIARGIFSALRELDKENVDAIFVEGIVDNEGDTAAAIMNRLRKAAEIRMTD